MTGANLSPKEFLKNRRPERFSDSITLKKHNLDRAVLEHHISTLNKRNQELDFETYARRMCEKIICPNLLAQTGPVSGGDGKVDTQTFPVSEQNKLMWFEGINDTSQKERWAFAVSTEKTWANKCRGDVRKINNTKRGYTKVFFITNQYAKSNQRSDIEDELRNETGIDVRILDISWLLDQTLKNNYEYIAIESLSIVTTQTNTYKLGPGDYKKNIKLEKLLKKIDEEVIPGNIHTYQVGMILEAAILSKELEKPPHETQGLFDRAARVAKQFGTNQQQFSAYYQYAWAAYWWFEDVSLFEMNFERAYETISDSSNSSKWSDFVTLISVFHNYAMQTDSKFSINYDSIKSHTKSQLMSIMEDDSRLSNSLQAKTLLILLDLIEIKAVEEAKPYLIRLLEISKECGSLIGYSFDSLFEFISGMDNIFGEMEEYETLMDYLTEQSSIRNGETQSSLLLLKRGIKRLESGQPYQSIKLVGRALTGLYKNESRKDIAVALSVIASAYSKIGLLWAARGNLLMAASLITDNFWQSDEISPAQVTAYMRLAWTECELGRIFQSLTWFQLAFIINNNLQSSNVSHDEKMNFDAFLSHSLLRSEHDTIKNLEKLPDLLDDLGLFNSRETLLYCLGYEELVAEELEIEIDSEFIDHLLMIRKYDFGTKTKNISTFTGRMSEIQSTVLGCDISVSFPILSPAAELAESILSAIEGFCSTGVIDNVIAVESKLRIEISSDDSDGVNISHEINDDEGDIVIKVMCSTFTRDMLNIESQGKIQSWLQELVLNIYSTIMMPKSFDKNIKSLLLDDKALERSISFGASFITLYNVLGKNAVKDISNLLEDHNGKRYEDLRKCNWDTDYPVEAPVNEKSSDVKPGNGEIPESLLYTENVSHYDISVHGLIKPRLWDKASWGGTAFTFYGDEIPGLSLVFKNEAAATSVFKNLFTEIGSIDTSNRIRISLIRKISSKEPFNYRISITENPKFNETKFVTMISRNNTMTPNSDDNLNEFLNAYQMAKAFRLGYCIQNGNNVFIPDDSISLAITKYELIIKDAWEIGINDIESVAISKNDKPVFPPNITDPPVAALLRKKKALD